MFYSATGKFIIKENFETDNVKTKSNDDNSLDVWHYDVNGNLRTGTKVSKNGNYEIWTGYCYDNNCPATYGKNKPNLIIDKDGVTHLKKACIEDACISRNKLKISNVMTEILLKEAVKGTSLEHKKIDDYSEAELNSTLDNLKKLLAITEEDVDYDL